MLIRDAADASVARDRIGSQSNPHYHQDSDLPETLDYTFLRQVTQLLIATTVTAARHE